MKTVLALLLVLCSATPTPKQGKVILAVGDSKTAIGLYQLTLVSVLDAATPYNWQILTVARGGAQLADLRRSQDKDIASVTTAPDYILLSVGTNDIRHRIGGELFADAWWWGWEWDMLQYVKAWHARFPNAVIFIASPRNYAGYSDYDFGPMDVAISDVLRMTEDYSRAGVYEASILPQHNVDKVHFDAQGYRLLGEAWATLIMQAMS